MENLSLRLLLRKIHLPRQREAFPVGKSYAINIEAEKLTFSIGENPGDGRERFTFSNSCDMIKKKAVMICRRSICSNFLEQRKIL